VSELESKEASQVKDYPAYGEPPQRPDPNSWERNIVATLSFVIPYTLTAQIAREWLPFYLAVGIGCIVGGLASFRFRQGRLSRYGFGKWVGFYLLVATGLSLVCLALENVVRVLRR
jgi:hypothetical protein